MCGIGGILRIWQPSAAPPKPGIPLPWIDTLSAALAHRGPDGRGVFIDRVKAPDGRIVDVALVHRRLAVIDPATGRQPMIASARLDPSWTPTVADSASPPAPPPAAADDLIAVVFNGCIYNHRSLRRELASHGAVFRSDHSDTEPILHAFNRWQGAFASRLEGMFALGVWDRRHARLVLARDRPGEKPLYTCSFDADDHAASRCLAFSSTVPALVRVARAAGGGSCREADPEVLVRWLRFGFDGQVPIRGIRPVPPGHTAVTDAGFGGWNTRPYWTLPARRDPARTITLDELDRVLAKAVADRLESDVALGCFLSGGIDSSLVAAYAAKARPGLRTFCVRMPDRRYDESPHARAVARRLGTRHVTLDVSPRPADDLLRLVPQIGLPLGDSSLLPTHWVAAAARSHVTVALSGDGGDELFMGYDRYRAAALLRDYGPLLRLLPAGRLGRFHPRSTPHRLGRLIVAAAYGGYEELLSIFPTPDLARLLPGVDAMASLRTAPGTRITDPALCDAASYLPDDLLRKVDTASMSVALEVRSPLLATAVVELGLSLPAHVLTPTGPKSLLRMVARRYLPDTIVSRPKSGFAIPLAEWIRSNHAKLGDLVRSSCESPSSFDGLGLDLDRRVIGGMIDEHMAASRDHGQRLYLLTVLALWNRWLQNPAG